VIGEYIGKLYVEAKRRPRYLIEKLQRKEQGDAHATRHMKATQRVPRARFVHGRAPASH
jgi:hypothetical protein